MLATASTPFSAGRRAARTRRSRPFVAAFRSSSRWAGCTPRTSVHCNAGSASLPGWSWSAARSGKGSHGRTPSLGEAPNLAARLQRFGFAGHHRHLRRHSPAARGIVRVPSARRASGRRGFPLRFARGARSACRLMPAAFRRPATVRTSFVGRRHELSLLNDRWRTACEGKSRAVLILGEAGMGKSRLASALHDEIVDQPHTFITWQCSPYHQAKPLYPVVEYITQTSRYRRRDAARGPAAEIDRHARGSRHDK